MDFGIFNIAESAVILSMFYMFYELLLKKETYFKLNRFYLLSSLIFAVTVPFISLNLNLFADLWASNDVFLQKISGIKKGYNEIGEVIIYAYSGKFFWTKVTDYLSLVYLIGVLISCIYFVFGLGRIIWMISRSNSKRYDKYRIVETSEAIVPFSLFKWIIINPEKFSSDDMKQIIAHEKMRAFQLHSFDLILVEVFVILFWFNPFIYWYRKSIRELHEYLADRAVVENGFDRLNYQQLLYSQVSGNRFIGLTSRFSYSLSKNRLKMLSMIKSKNSSKIKIALAIPFAIVAIFFFANSNELVKASGKVKTDTQFAIDTSVVNTSKIAAEDPSLGTVYFTCEVMPKFQGQEPDAFRFFIQENMKYPEEAQKKGISGRVFIQFDVDVEGSVKNVIVVRGVDPLLDNEAVRVTRSSPKWEPGYDKGEPVSVRYTFPIVFALK